MNLFGILTNLPTSLACSVLRDWLNLKAVAALNVAYCRKTNRGFLEELLQSDEYYIKEEVALPRSIVGLCNLWNGLPKFGRMLRSVAFQKKLSEAQGRLVAQHCTNLTHVHFEKQNSPPALWSILEANRNIEHMYLHFNLPPGTKRLFPEGMSLPKLGALAMVCGDSQHVHIVEALQLSNNISRLKILGSEVNESTIDQIALSCPHLTALGLMHTPLNDDVLSQLTRSCPYIKHLNLERTDLTDAGILAVVQNLKGLQSLNIKFNYDLTDASLVHIFTHCANLLEKLHMDCEYYGFGDSFGATAVHELLERCTKLRSFLFKCWDFSDAAIDSGITIPAATLGILTELVLSGNIACERNLVAISRYGINLQNLGFDAFMCNECSHAAWMGLLQGCPKLMKLYVSADPSEIMRVSNWAEIRPELIVGTSLPVHLQGFDMRNI